jgi:basic membrane protein A
MRTQLKVVFASLIVTAGIALLAGCGSSSPTSGTANTSKIGLILVGDETEAYSEAHLDGIAAAATKLGISDRLIYKKKVAEDSNCQTAINDLIANDCGLIVSNSYGHQDYMDQGAASYPDAQFVALTGDYAKISGKTNFKNAFVSIYEARYVTGVVAGMKLKALAEAGSLDTTFNQDGKGNWKVGYVGAYQYAEVISGFTSFYLGIKSVISNVVMDVQFTNSWFDIDAESNAADTLAKEGCVIIGQHADSTGAPAKVESLLGKPRSDNTAKNYVCYSVGFNIDMISTAPKAALTSAINNWEIYYEYLFNQFINKGAIADDWCEGYNGGAVGISTLNSAAVAAGTQAKVDDAIAKIEAGTLQVFDTSTFTVSGAAVSTYTVDLSKVDYSTNKIIYAGDKVEAIKTSKGISYFSESTYRSAPYFDLKIDGITWLN